MEIVAQPKHILAFIAELPSICAFPDRPINPGCHRPPPAPLSPLPDIPAVYFILSPSGEVLYIGAARRRLRWRWFSHHSRTNLQKVKDARIAWVKLPVECLRTVEMQLMRRLNPAYNHHFQHYPDN